MSDPDTAPPRLITVTLNPSVDISSSTAHVVAEKKLRCDPPAVEPGGGGINVSRVANGLGASVSAVLTAGGPAGQDLLRLLTDEAIVATTIPVEASTRQNVTISDRGTGEQFRFVFPGPRVSPDELDACTRAVHGEISATRPRVVVLSGSLPDGVPSTWYASLASEVATPDTLVIGDCSGPALEALLGAPAYLVKPSRHELAAMVNRDLHTEDEVVEAANRLLAEGRCRAMVVSLGPHGAVVVTAEHEVIKVRAPAVRPVSAVGAGDSMVAAMAVALARNETLTDAVMLGVAAGTAAVLTPGSQLCQAELVAKMLPRVHLEP